MQCDFCPSMQCDFARVCNAILPEYAMRFCPSMQCDFARVCNAILPEYVMRFCPRYPAHFLTTIIVFCSMIFCYFSKGLYVVRIPLLLYLWVGISFSQRLHIVVSKLNAIWNKKNSVNYYKTGHVAMMGLLMMTSGYFKSTLISAAGYLPARESTLCK